MGRVKDVFDQGTKQDIITVQFGVQITGPREEIEKVFKNQPIKLNDRGPTIMGNVVAEPMAPKVIKTAKAEAAWNPHWGMKGIYIWHTAERAYIAVTDMSDAHLRATIDCLKGALRELQSHTMYHEMKSNIAKHFITTQNGNWANAQVSVREILKVMQNEIARRERSKQRVAGLGVSRVHIDEVDEYQGAGKTLRSWLTRHWKVASDQRSNTVYQIALAFERVEMPLSEAKKGCLRWNTECCFPHLPPHEVCRIVEAVYQSDEA